MPLSLLTETAMTFRGLATRWLPGSNGKRLHTRTLHRWRARGLCGVRLEAVKVGGRWCTSLEAIGRFLDRLSARRPTG